MSEHLLQQTLPPEMAAMAEYYEQGVTPPTPADAAASRYGHLAAKGNFPTDSAFDELVQTEMLRLGESALNPEGAMIADEELALRVIGAFEAAGLIARDDALVGLQRLGVLDAHQRLNAAAADAGKDRDYSSATAQPRRDMNPALAQRLGINTRRGLTQSEVAFLLNGQRADGEEIKGRTKRATTLSVGNIFKLDHRRKPTPIQLERVLAGRTVDDVAEQEFAERTFSQLEGFGSYGFPESHAASFALIAYASSWLKCHHPDVFCAALLNAQPMGFYAPAQIVRDAINHGIEVRPVCVNASRWDCTLEPTDIEDRFAVRLGLRMVKGLGNIHAAQLVGVRAEQKFTSVDDLWRRAGIPATTLVQIAEADAFLPSLKLARREAMWAIKALRDEPLPLFATTSSHDSGFLSELAEPAVTLRPMTGGSEVVEDYVHLGLTLRAHPLSFLRDDLRSQKIVTCDEGMRAKDNKWLEVAGVVLVRQKPGSAKGVMFITIEDETGIANLVIWPSLYEKQRRVILTASMMSVYGRIQREGEVVHLIAHRLTDHSSQLTKIGERDAPFPLPRGRGDEAKSSGGPDPREALGRKPRDIYVPDRHIDMIKVKTRNFR